MKTRSRKSGGRDLWANKSIQRMRGQPFTSVAIRTALAAWLTPLVLSVGHGRPAHLKEMPALDQ